MENMGPVFVDADAFLFLAIHVAAHVRTALQNKASFTCFRHLVCEYRTEQTTANDQVI
jgi:hypothetical protein